MIDAQIEIALVRVTFFGRGSVDQRQTDRIVGGLVPAVFAVVEHRDAVRTVGVGQVEAARSLGMSFSRILAKIVIPQALRSSVLPMTNLFIAVMLTTALGSQVPLKPQELTGVVSYINTRSLGGVAAFFISALGYLGTAFVVSHIGNYIDKKVRILR